MTVCSVDGEQVQDWLEMLKDYPAPPDCTSPFAPTWIPEMARRREQA